MKKTNEQVKTVNAGEFLKELETLINEFYDGQATLTENTLNVTLSNGQRFGVCATEVL